MKDSCVKFLETEDGFFFFFLLFPLRVATLRLEPRSHCLLCRRGLHGKSGNEVVLIHSA